MNGTDRKQLILDYKNRPLNAGVFLVRCRPTDMVWVGANPDLVAARNALWFVLRLGRQRNPTLQAAWNAHGEDAFVFEPVDTLEPDLDRALISDELKRRLRHWAAHYRAETLLR